MKSKLLALALGAVVSFGAVADPVASLPGGPLYLKFNGNEQIAINGASTWTNTADIAANASHAGEINWGVFTMSTIDKGVVDTPKVRITDSGNPIFVSPTSNNAQITGMFYGATAATGPSQSAFPATGGFLDLYWRDLNVYSQTSNSTSAASVRTGYSTATGYTDGVFLGRVKFVAGIDTGNSGITIAGSVVPTDAPGGFTGLATSFASIDLSAGGAWATQLDTNYFSTFFSSTFGDADLRFKNSYQDLARWNGAAGSNIIGATIDDPAQAFAVPEPGMLSLMGLAMLSMAAIRRRKQK